MHLNIYAWVPPLQNITLSFVQFQNSGMIVTFQYLNIHAWVPSIASYCLWFFTVRNEVAKVMFLQASVCPEGMSAPGGAWSRGGLVQGVGVCLFPGGWSGAGGCLLPGVGGCLVLGVSAPRGVSGPGGLVSQHALRQIPPLAEMATAADGTHPTGMHSYFQFQHSGVMIFLHLNIYAWVTPPHHLILASISTFRCGDLFCT